MLLLSYYIVMTGVIGLSGLVLAHSTVAQWVALSSAQAGSDSANASVNIGTTCTAEQGFVIPTQMSISFTFTTQPVDSGNGNAATPSVNSSITLTSPVNSDTNPAINVDGMGTLFGSSDKVFTIFDAPTMRYDYPCQASIGVAPITSALKIRSQSSSRVNTAIMGYNPTRSDTNLSNYTEVPFSGSAAAQILGGAATTENMGTIFGRGSATETNKFGFVAGRDVSDLQNGSGSVTLDLTPSVTGS